MCIFLMRYMGLAPENTKAALYDCRHAGAIHSDSPNYAKLNRTCVHGKAFCDDHASAHKHPHVDFLEALEMGFGAEEDQQA